MPEVTDQPAKPPRLASAIRAGVPGVIELAGFGVLFLFLTFCQTVIAEIVHSWGHTQLAYSLLAKTYDDGTRMPMLVGGCLCLFGAIDSALVSHDRKSSPGLRVLRAFAWGGLATLALYGIFIRTDGENISPLYWRLGGAFSCGMALGVVAAVLAWRFDAIWTWALSLIPPVGTCVAMCLLARTTSSGSESLPLWPSPPKLAVAVISVTLAGIAIATVERRVSGEWRSTRGLVFVTCWLGAVVCLLGAIYPWHHMCFHYRHEQEQLLAVPIVLALAAGATALRLLIHRLVSRTVRQAP